MKLIIDIPKDVYKASQIIDVKYEDVIQIPLEVLANGTPLDDVKAKIQTTYDSIPWRYTDYDDGWVEALEWVLEVFDNIGKAESENKE